MAITKNKIIKELREILKVYHYKSDTENMSKDVVTSLENLLGTILKGEKPCPTKKQ